MKYRDAFGGRCENDLGEFLNVRLPVVQLGAANQNGATAKKAAVRLKVAFTTAQRAVEKLLKESILVQVAGDKRDRVYCAKAIMDILDEPAKLRPAKPTTK